MRPETGWGLSEPWRKMREFRAFFDGETNDPNCLQGAIKHSTKIMPSNVCARKDIFSLGVL